MLQYYCNRMYIWYVYSIAVRLYALDCSILLYYVLGSYTYTLKYVHQRISLHLIPTVKPPFLKNPQD